MLVWDADTSRLYATDAGNSRLLEYDLGSGIIDGMDATHVLGQADFFHGGKNRDPGAGNAYFVIFITDCFSI